MADSDLPNGKMSLDPGSFGGDDRGSTLEGVKRLLEGSDVPPLEGRTYDDAWDPLVIMERFGPLSDDEG